MSDLAKRADPRAERAARNNADWYQAMFEAHGLGFERTDVAFRALDRTPAYHSALTIQSSEAGADIEGLVESMSTRDGFTVKDSFRALDLERLSLVPFIEASWIHRERPGAKAVDGWQRVTDDTELRRWEEAWSEGSPVAVEQFPPAILRRRDVALFGRTVDGRYDAGAIANLSADCVGLSNVFGAGALEAAADLCADFGDGLPVVGYERGDSLREALSIGFDDVGRLRVCAVRR